MIISLIILLVISIITVSLGWYIAQEEVTAQDAQVGAEQSAAASISSELIETSHYGGQLGNKPSPHEDAPYVINTNVTLSASNVLDSTKLRIDLSRLIISKGTLDDIDLYVENTYSPEENMTYRVRADGITYFPNADGYLVKESNPNEFYQVINGENAFILDIIFLDEVKYLQWGQDSVSSFAEYTLASPGVSYFDWLETQPQYFDYEPCAYSAPLYMYTNFYLTVEYITEI